MYRRILLFLVCVFSSIAAYQLHAQIPTIGTPLHTFGVTAGDPAYPAGSLSIGPDGALYGTTFGSSNSGVGGAIYKINRDGTGYAVLRNFSSAETSDAQMAGYPFNRIGLSISRETDGALYGTIFSGGTNSAGAVFKINTDGSQYTILHSFISADGSPRALTLGNDGVLYGIGTSIFKLYVDGSGYAVLHTMNASTDGGAATATLIQGGNGELYGTAFNSGPANNGTVFKVDPAGSNFSVIYSFPNALDGTSPAAGLLLGQDGLLYGVTTRGGTNSDGAVFRLATDGSGFQRLYSFGTTSTDGVHPYGSLVQGISGKLYGTTETSAGGQASVGGTVFEINPDGTGYVTLYNGSAAFGYNSYIGVVLGSFQGDTGILYGAASSGGVNGSTNLNFGTVFSVIANPVATITPGVSQSGNSGPVVFWPQWALGYQLQTTTNLASPNWQPITNGVPVTGVQLTNPATTSYYRLVYPN